MLSDSYPHLQICAHARAPLITSDCGCTFARLCRIAVLTHAASSVNPGNVSHIKLILFEPEEGLHKSEIKNTEHTYVRCSKAVFYHIPLHQLTSCIWTIITCGCVPASSTELRQMPGGINHAAAACLRSLTQCNCLVLNRTRAGLKHQHQPVPR